MVCLQEPVHFMLVESKCNLRMDLGMAKCNRGDAINESTQNSYHHIWEYDVNQWLGLLARPLDFDIVALGLPCSSQFVCKSGWNENNHTTVIVQVHISKIKQGRIPILCVLSIGKTIPTRRSTGIIGILLCINDRSAMRLVCNDKLDHRSFVGTPRMCLFVTCKAYDRKEIRN